MSCHRSSEYCGAGCVEEPRPGRVARSGRRCALIVSSAVALSLLTSSSALATTGHSFADQFGGPGSGAGQFTAGGPSGIAVLQSTGEVFAGDPTHTLVDGTTPDPRVEVFDASGAAQSSFSIDAAAFNASTQLAVDPAGSGSLYVSTGAGTVLKYSAAGVFAYALDGSTSTTAVNPSAGVAVDPGTGTVYVTATDTGTGAQVIDSFDGTTGAFVSSFDGAGAPAGALFCPSALAADGAHQLYVLDQTCFGAGQVFRFSTAGVFGQVVDDASRGSAAAVTADPATSEVFVGELGGLGAQVTQFTAGGAAAGQSFGPPSIAGLSGLAVNSATGAVYTADNASSFVERFTTFDGPTVSTTTSASVDPTSETLNGTIDPEGVSSTYHFQYGLDTNYGTQTAESDPLAGSGAVPAMATAAGLLPNTLYHFRIVGTNASGSITGGDQTFTTAPAPPALDGSPAFAAAITPTGATLNGTLNPNSSDTTFHFEYGTDTGYGTSTPPVDAGAGIGDQPVTVDLTGLAAGTTYHYRLVADNGTGGVQHGADNTFSTAPATAPSATGVTVFGAVLHGTVNPHGTATTYRFEYGTDTTYGRSTAETDAGSGSMDEPVAQPTGRLAPGTTYHFRVVSTSSGQTTSSADETLTTGAMPVATATDPTGVSTSQATVGGTVDTHGKPGTYRFFVDAIDGSYTTVTDAQAAPTGEGPNAVSAALSGLPAGERFRVVLSLTSNEATATSDQAVFATAPLQAPPPRPPASADGPYGCTAPVLNAYDQHPRAGDTIALTGSDLGAGGTVALGGTPVIPSRWTADGFTVQVPDSATGTLALTANCGHASNTIAIAVYQAPDNRFTITKTTVKGTTAALTLKLPGVGKVQTSGNHTAAKTTTVTKAGTATVKVALSSAGKKALKKAKSKKLKATIRLKYTPAGGTAATLTKTLTFKTGSTR